MKHIILTLLFVLFCSSFATAQSDEASDYKLYYQDSKWSFLYDSSSVYEKSGHILLWSLAISRTSSVGALSLVELNCANASVRVHRSFAMNTETNARKTLTTPSKWLKADAVTRAMKSATCGQYLLELTDRDME